MSETPTIRIVNRFDGSVLWEGPAATMKDAIHAALAARANLSRANLSGANLSGANLSGANLSWANLSRANLSGATGVSPERSTPLLMLLDQPGPIRAYKLVTADGRSPIHHSKLSYAVGHVVTVDDANTDPAAQCAAGISVATLDWCLANWSAGCRVFIVEFTAVDIAAIPTNTDGKFRLHRCAVVAEKPIAHLVPASEVVRAS